MAEYINRKALYEELCEAGGCGAEKNSWADGWDKGIYEAIRLLNKAPTADVVARAEVKALQDCIYDLYEMLEKIIDNAKHHDLAALRPPRDASGFYAYQGAPPHLSKI